MANYAVIRKSSDSVHWVWALSGRRMERWSKGRRRIHLCAVQETGWGGSMLGAGWQRWLAFQSESPFWSCASISQYLSAPPFWPPDTNKDNFYDKLCPVVAKKSYLKHPHTPRRLECLCWQIQCLIWEGAWRTLLGHKKYRGREITGVYRVLQPGHRQHMFRKWLNHLITFVSGERRTQIDYVLFRKTFRSMCGMSVLSLARRSPSNTTW